MTYAEFEQQYDPDGKGAKVIDLICGEGSSNNIASKMDSLDASMKKFEETCRNFNVEEFDKNNPGLRKELLSILRA